ncbi:MAG: hypothetical protein HOI23_11475 [Deltaproteobacteria bacterium]|nr:hypothetical protein [Deltaproteobacteria bacterium]
MSCLVTSEACNSTSTGIRPHCGDGSRTDDEVCDEGSQNSNIYNDSLTNRERCNLTCDGYRAHCGDGVVEPRGGCLCLCTGKSLRVQG